MSPTSIHALSEVAFGLESEAGTVVVADTGLVVDEGLGVYTETIERQVREAPRGVLAAHVESVLTRKQSGIQYTQDLTYEEFPIVQLGGLKQTTGGAGPTDFTYTTTPSLTAPETLDSFSFEVFCTDGSTQHYKRKFAYGQCSEFTVTLAFGQPAKLAATWFGRAGQALASPASPAVLTGREIIPSDLFKLYIDSSWANLGTTQKSGLIRSGTFRVMTGVNPDFTLDGRADLDFTQLRRGPLDAEVEIVAEFNADAATEFAAYQAGTVRFISLEAAGTSNRALKLQAAVQYIEPPEFSEEDGLVVVRLRGRGIYDATSGSMVSCETTNQLSAY